MTATKWLSLNFQVFVTSFHRGLFLWVGSGFVDVCCIFSKYENVLSVVWFSKSLEKEFWNWSLTLRNCIFDEWIRSSSNGYISLICGGASFDFYPNSVVFIFFTVLKEVVLAYHLSDNVIDFVIILFLSMCLVGDTMSFKK